DKEDAIKMVDLVLECLRYDPRSSIHNSSPGFIKGLNRYLIETLNFTIEPAHGETPLFKGAFRARVFEYLWIYKNEIIHGAILFFGEDGARNDENPKKRTDLRSRYRGRIVFIMHRLF